MKSEGDKPEMIATNEIEYPHRRTISEAWKARLKSGIQPNLIYVFADQLRYQSCGFAGDMRARTPNIDGLASEGVNFCNAVSGHPVCAPYRASLFTGKYSSSTGMAINELRMNPHHECFGHVLTRNGYQTAYIGKWHLYANELGNHYAPKNSFIPPGVDRLGFDGYWAAYNFHHRYYDAYYHTNTPEKIKYGGTEIYEPDAQTDMAINFLQETADEKQPFALFLSYGTPHDQWVWDNVPKDYADMFRDVSFPLPPNYSDDNDKYADRWGIMNAEERSRLEQWQQVYYAMTANLDWNFGRLLDAVNKANTTENTLVVFTSDHGEMFGAHGRRAKNIFYEEACRVPFLVRWSHAIPAGHVTDVCLNTPDIMPTILSLMGLPIPEAVEGMSLSHCALGEEGPEPEAAFMQGMGTTAAWVNGHEWRALRDKRFTYAVYRVDGSELLFDNQFDPYQMRNLINDPKYSEKHEYFREMLKGRMSELNDTFESCTWYREHWTKDRIILRSATLSSGNEE